MSDRTDSLYRAAARNLLRHPFDCDIPRDAVVTADAPDGGDPAEGGRWVQTWVFVPDDELADFDPRVP